MIRSWKWFWVWMVLNVVMSTTLSALGVAFGIYGWIAAAIVVIASAPIVIRIEYKISDKEWRRAKKP